MNHSHKNHEHCAHAHSKNPQSEVALPLLAKVEYTCPMHPEIRQIGAGTCPKCGMALEPVQVTTEQSNPELTDFRQRFWWTLPLTLLAVFIAMSGGLLDGWLGAKRAWVEMALATPAVLWAGLPFFVRGWQSLRKRSLNMWTLIAIGVGVAYTYSVVATLAPQLFPASFRTMGGQVAVYFEAAAVIVSLTLLGQILELKARSETGAARHCQINLVSG